VQVYRTVILPGWKLCEAWKGLGGRSSLARRLAGPHPRRARRGPSGLTDQPDRPPKLSNRP